MLNWYSRRSYSRNACDLLLVGQARRPRPCSGWFACFPGLGMPSVLQALGPHGFKEPSPAPGKRQRRLPGLPRGALATRSEERTPPTRARPFVVGATNKTPLPRGFRGLCFDHCYYGRFCGPIPRFNFFLNSDSTMFLCPGHLLVSLRVSCCPKQPR